MDTVMKSISLLTYTIKQGFKNIRRNRKFSLASIGTIAASLFLFGIFYFLLSNIQYMIKNAETSVGVSVFFEEGMSQEKIEEIGDTIRTRQELETINFVSAEEAWERCKKEMFQNQEALTETFAEDNPLADSASYEIYLNDVSRQEEFVKFVESIDGVRQVNSSDTVAKGLTSFNALVGYSSAAIIIILIAVAIFLINTTIAMGISVRKEEISIMKLIGATDFFIRAPFIVEGIMIGFIGTIIPLVILRIIYSKAIVYIMDKFSVLSVFLTFLDVKVVFQVLIPLSFALGAGIGLLGSYITVRKHLNE